MIPNLIDAVKHSFQAEGLQETALLLPNMKSLLHEPLLLAVGCKTHLRVQTTLLSSPQQSLCCPRLWGTDVC